MNDRLFAPHVIYLAISIILGVFGQLQFKLGANQLDFSSVANVFRNNQNLFCGVFLYGVSLVFYILSLKRIPLSIAFPAVSTSYIGVVLMAHFFLHESLNGIHIIGLIMIIAGVSCLGIAGLR